MSQPPTTSTYPWHQDAWAKLASAKEQNHLPHALILAGSNGTGRRDFADNLAALLLCTSPVNNKACQQCQSCKTYYSGANPDFKKVELEEDKKNISIDQIRKLSEFMNYTRSFEAHRVIIIDPLERLNQSSANGLLKSLEEPASHTLLILLATNVSRLLPTIKSRCQLLALPTPSTDEALVWMKQQSSELKNPESLLEMANGQPLNALNIDNERLQNRQDFSEHLLAVCSGQKSVTEVAKEWVKFSLETMLNWQITWLQSLIKQRSLHYSYKGPDSQSSLAIKSPFIAKLDKIVGNSKQWELHQNLIEQKQYIHTSVNALIFIETMLLLWLQASSVLSISSD